MNVAEHIERGARDYPERPALLFEGRPMSYRECHQLSSQAAGAFRSAGVAKGDRVALFLPNVPEFVVAYLGVLKLGAIAVSMNAGLKNDETGFVLSDCEPKVVVTTPELRGRLPHQAAGRVYTTGGDFEEVLGASAAVPAAKTMAPSDPAAIVYTSGTNGRPKGATLSHVNIVRNIDAKVRYLGIRPEDRALLFLPLYHCFGQNAVLNAVLQAGATVVLQQRFDFDRIMASIAHDGVTMFFGVPASYILLLDKVSSGDMAAVRYYFSAAAPLPVEIEERWTKKFSAPIFQGYGLSETSPFASYNHPREHRPGSIGTPIEGVEMKIVDPQTGREAAPGEKGEIVIRGHNVMLGYWNRPEDTARAIRDGWFHTGDIGHIDDRGYFFIEDRLSDVIISGGVNIYPAEIENVLAAHPAIAEAAVYGIPELLLGEQVCADVVLKPGAKVTETEIRAFCRTRLADVKSPAVVNFTTDIPRGATGKILKRVLRERARTGEPATPAKKSNASRNDVRRWIHTWLLANLDAGANLHFDSRTAFADLGMDSILAVRLARELGDWLGRPVEVTAAWSFPSEEAMAEHVAREESWPLAGAFSDRSSEDLSDENLSDEAARLLLMVELEQLNR
jgi:long-chain acyl-CoA synthetase